MACAAAASPRCLLAFLFPITMALKLGMKARFWQETKPDLTQHTHTHAKNKSSEGKSTR